MVGDPDQLLLFDSTASRRSEPVRPSRGAFFGVRPPERQAEAMAQLALDVSKVCAGRALPSERLHLSLNGVDRQSSDPGRAIEQARRAACAVALPPFDIAFDRIVSWPRTGPFPTVLCCSCGEQQLGQLFTALGAEMRRVGLCADTSPGTPHITLCWGRRQMPEQLLPWPFRWTVDQFWLIETLIGKRRHRWHGDWPLRDGAVAQPVPAGCTLPLF